MDLELSSKKILITGASRGIGLAIAESFLQEGAHTCLVSRGSEELLKNQRRLQGIYGKDNVISFECDCTKKGSLSDLKKNIEGSWNCLDVAIVNVGDGRSVEDALPDDESWQKTWNINFESALQTARTFLPMLKHSNGSLLFISSIAGLEAFGAPTDYSTSKAALIALSKNMSRKLAQSVRVNVIAPGNVFFEGGSWDEKIKKDKESVHKIIKSNVPMNRFATTKEIADSAVFLSSNRASFITGVTLVVDGGQTVGVY